MVDWFSIYKRVFFPSVVDLQLNYLIIYFLAWLKFEINLYQIAFRKGICYLVRRIF
jgi:hypothetical protein